MTESIIKEIKRLKREKNAVILCHIYQPPDIQDIADYVGDSLGLSRQAADTSSDIIVFCGVRFMAETAAILNPGKKVIMPDPDAGCPMADMITPDGLNQLKQQYPGVPVVCYVNSTSETKAMSDVCVTSANAVSIVNKLPDDRIIFIPDKYLGLHIQRNSDKDIILWDGCCPVHVNILPSHIDLAKKEHPEAVVMVHPETTPEVQDAADYALSTGQMCRKAFELEEKEFIIGTETGILYTLKKQNPDKHFFPVFEQIICPDMKKMSLQKLLNSLEGEPDEITVIGEIAERAEKAIIRMLDMSV
ncbi:quinolinate synthase NadA [Planctomycetota bacterium]